MDKSCHSSGDSTTTTASSSSNSRDQYLKHLNKLSHKISKPIIKKPSFDHPNHQNQTPNQNNATLNHQPPSTLPPPPPPPPNNNLQQHQPPVYNINKNDFREVVQKLTGSPAHERISTPPPIHAPKPPSSRLQRIRPPPLAQISNRPSPLLNSAIPPQPPEQQPPPPVIATASVFGRPTAPLSPLPPFPAVHAAAESPVSAYMRYLRGSISAVDSNPKQFSGFSPLAPLVSPRWNSLTSSQPHPPPAPQLQPHPPPPQQELVPPPPVGSQAQFQLPSSPLPFGCLNSPRSPYPLVSPGLIFSPSGQLGFPQLPLSPTVPVPSPKWR